VLTSTHAFDLSLGVGWHDFLSWYLVGWARFMEMVVVESRAQQDLPDIGDIGGLGWHWDLGGASYHILEM